MVLMVPAAAVAVLALALAPGLLMQSLLLVLAAVLLLQLLGIPVCHQSLLLLRGGQNRAIVANGCSALFQPAN